MFVEIPESDIDKTNAVYFIVKAKSTKEAEELFNNFKGDKQYKLYYFKDNKMSLTAYRDGEIIQFDQEFSKGKIEIFLTANKLSFLPALADDYEYVTSGTR